MWHVSSRVEDCMWAWPSVSWARCDEVRTGVAQVWVKGRELLVVWASCLAAIERQDGRRVSPGTGAAATNPPSEYAGRRVAAAASASGGCARHRMVVASSGAASELERAQACDFRLSSPSRALGLAKCTELGHGGEDSNVTRRARCAREFPSLASKFLTFRPCTPHPMTIGQSGAAGRRPRSRARTTRDYTSI